MASNSRKDENMKKLIAFPLFALGKILIASVYAIACIGLSFVLGLNWAWEKLDRAS